MAGICDDQQRLCFALALWNGHDAILKERMFGLTGTEGNHGEDVKEYYFYLDSTPTHSYMQMLYKYPQAAFPYADLVETNRQRSRQEPEYELLDTGIFAGERYFDVSVEYAKAGPEDILIRISATNRSREAAELHVLPTFWFRNTWSWGDPDEDGPRPRLRAGGSSRSDGTIVADHPSLGRYVLAGDGAADAVFTENETNLERLYGIPNPAPFVKDGINNYVVSGCSGYVNPEKEGSKAALHYHLTVRPGETATVRLRLSQVEMEGDGQGADGHGNGGHISAPSFADFEAVFARRREEADAFYAALQPGTLTDDERRVQRQAFAGMLWSKQFYHYDVEQWLRGDPAQPPPPPGAAWVATMSGPISTRQTSSRCPTNGSTPGSPPGTWHFIACRWPWSIRSLPRSS